MRNKIEVTEGQDVYILTEFNGAFPAKVVKVTPTGKISAQPYRRDGSKIDEVYRFGADGYREGAHLSSYKWRRDHIDTQMTFAERTFDLVKKVRQNRVHVAFEKVFAGRGLDRNATQEQILERITEFRQKLNELEIMALGIDEPIEPMNLEQLLASMKPTEEPHVPVSTLEQQ